MVIMYAYELFTIIQISSYIWMNSRFKGLSIEFKNIQNGVWMKELCPSEVGGLKVCRGYAIAWKPTQ